jgi:hypothetical protein
VIQQISGKVGVAVVNGVAWRDEEILGKASVTQGYEESRDMSIKMEG